MSAIRSFTIACAAAAIVAAPSVVRADDYNKLTYLTFSAPVQVPGVTLPAGKYMFKLANPESGRRAIQIWQGDGSELLTTLLTIPDEQEEPKSDPVVMFNETPAGTAAAIRSWFYPGDRYGLEFIYPREQAQRIAAGANTSVLAYTDDAERRDEAAMRSAEVGRIDAQGQIARQDASPADTPETTSDATAATAGSTATADASSTAPQGAAQAPSANRTASGAADSSGTAVGTSGSASTGASAAQGSAASAQPETADDRSNTAADRQPQPTGTAGAQRPAQLPQTASSLGYLAVFSVLSLAGAAGIRQFRRRYAMNR
jgi:hypothetical protein